MWVYSAVPLIYVYDRFGPQELENVQTLRVMMQCMVVSLIYVYDHGLDIHIRQCL